MLATRPPPRGQISLIVPKIKCLTSFWESWFELRCHRSRSLPVHFYRWCNLAPPGSIKWGSRRDDFFSSSRRSLFGKKKSVIKKQQRTLVVTAFFRGSSATGDFPDWRWNKTLRSKSKKNKKMASWNRIEVKLARRCQSRSAKCRSRSKPVEKLGNTNDLE